MDVGILGLQDGGGRLRDSGVKVRRGFGMRFSGGTCWGEGLGESRHLIVLQICVWRFSVLG